MINPASLHVQPAQPQQGAQQNRAPLFQWAVRTFGLTMPEVQQYYAKMAQESAAKGQDINQMSNAQLVTMINHVMGSPKIVAAGQKAGNIDKSGKVIPGSMMHVHQPMLHREGGGPIPAGSTAVVGENGSEIVDNSTGTPQVIPNPSDPNVPAQSDSDELPEQVVTAQKPDMSGVDHSPQSIDLPATHLANVLGISKEDAVKILPQLQAAYQDYLKQTSGSSGHNIAAGLQRVGGWIGGGAAGAANAENIIKAQDANTFQDTVGLPVAMQKATGTAIDQASKIGQENQLGFDNQAKNFQTATNIQILKDSMDPDSELSGNLRQALTKPAADAGITIPTHASAAQISQIVAQSAPLEKIANETITAQAARQQAVAANTKAGADVTNADTERFKTEYNTWLYNGKNGPPPVLGGHSGTHVATPSVGAPPAVPNTASNGGGSAPSAPGQPTPPAAAPPVEYVPGASGNPELAPQEVEGRKAFEARKQAANDYAGTSQQISSQIENAFDQTLRTPSNQFGPGSLKTKVTGMITGNTPQQALNANLQKVGALNLADQARQIGSSAELRSASIDNKFIGSSPDATKDGKNVVVDKLLAQAELHARNQMYANELAAYAKQHPEDPKGVNFKSNVSNRVFLVNLDAQTPSDQRFALVTREEAGKFLKRGYVTVPQAEKADMSK